MSKSLTQLKAELKEELSQLDEIQLAVQYGSDYKLSDQGNGKYRIVRARRIKVGDRAPSPEDIQAPEVGDDDRQDRDALKSIYTKYLGKTVDSIRKNATKAKQASEKDSEKPVKESLEEVSEEVLEERKKIPNKKSESDPPFTLVLKREYIRMYPKGLKVAIYYSKELDKHFSIPYGNISGTPVIQAEEVSVDVSREFSQNFISNLLEVYDSLSENNQKQLKKLVSEDYQRAQEFLNIIQNQAESSRES